MDAYTQKRGSLKIKGVSVKKTGKKSKSVSPDVGKNEQPNGKGSELRFDIGEGRIVSTELTVQGIDTKFLEQVMSHQHLLPRIHIFTSSLVVAERG